jgi:hypothetical protein
LPESEKDATARCRLSPMINLDLQLLPFTFHPGVCSSGLVSED